MRGSDQTIAQIFKAIETLKGQIAHLEALVHLAISEDDTGEHIFVDGTLVEEEDRLVDAEIIEDSKPAAKRTKREIRLEGQRRAREWAKSLKKPDKA
jgi:hypothetical protein